MSSTPSPVTQWLSRQPRWALAAWAMIAAFVAYGSMYAFRKPFSAAVYSGTYFGLDYKTLLVLSQLAGYTVSKFLGIKFVSETTAAHRAGMVLLLIGIAEVSLLLFAWTPRPWNAVWLFCNGLPLGMVWGLIFGFLEGRRVTEFMALGLSLSLIFASGWTKAAGLHMMQDWGVSETWMPVVTGALFLPVLLVSLWMLAMLPPPDEADVAARHSREPMDSAARRSFLRQNWQGLTLLIAGYVFLGVYRDIRDTFQVDILKELGVTTKAGQLALIETVAGVIVIGLMGFFALVRSNRGAVTACGLAISFGGVLTGAATLLMQKNVISAPVWMTLTGVGLYFAYVPFQAILFERMLAFLKTAGTAAFLITLCDSYGYLSTVAVYLWQTFGGDKVSWSGLMIKGGYALALAIPVLILGGIFLMLRPKKAA